MQHIMLDLETLGLTPNGVIASIGAVKFDATTIIDRFHVGVDVADCQRRGLSIDASTVMWWLHPDRHEAREKLLALAQVDLYAALDGFSLWVAETPPDQLGSLWGKGSTFDNVLLKNGFDKVGLPYPFSYRQDECYRTIANRFPDVPYMQRDVAHDALADAESQAYHLQDIAAAHGIAL